MSDPTTLRARLPKFLEISRHELWRDKHFGNFMANCLYRFAEQEPAPFGDGGNVIMLWRQDYEAVGNALHEAEARLRRYEEALISVREHSLLTPEGDTYVQIQDCHAIAREALSDAE